MGLSPNAVFGNSPINFMNLKIESATNLKIKNIVKLRESSRERERQGLFIIEGDREIGLARQGEVEIESLMYCRDYAKRELAGDYKNIVEVSKKVFAKISYRENPDGFLAVAKIKELKLEKMRLSANPLIVALEAVEKPGNLGAILRTADASGADAVIINDSKTDLYNPNVIRASQGAVFTVAVIVSSIPQTVKFCQKNNIKILAAAPGAAKEYLEVDYQQGCAIILGAEDKGLSKDWLAAADEKIKIKMRGQIDSLNVSVSAAVILFEALRQRQGGKTGLTG